MGVENLREEVLTAMENKPKWSRKGQFVFNYINERYGSVARIAQFKYGIDCFYRDDKIDEFIDCCINILKSKLC
jgi:hypothetical protein